MTRKTSEKGASKTGKSFRREILDLTKLPEEEQVKGTINATKSGVPFSSVITIKDSAAARGATETSESTEEPEVQSDQESEVRNEEVPEDDNEDGAETLTPQFSLSDIQEAINNAVSSAVSPIQERLVESERVNQELRTQLESTQSELTESKKSSNAINQLSQLLGQRATPQQGQTVEMPGVNLNSSSNQEPTGIFKEFMQERDASGVKYVRSKRGGALIPSYDTSRIDRFVHDNKLYDKRSPGYRQLMADLTDIGKRHGLFQGRKSVTEAEVKAATTAGNIPGGFLEVLSSIMRLSARPGLVMWQFCKTVHEFEQGYGELVDIPRAAYPTPPGSSNDRLLSGSGTFSRISDSNDSVQTGIVQLRLDEYGRGREGSPPIAIPTFVSSFSMIRLMDILERDLFWDYYHWEDLAIRELWMPTTQVFYNNGDKLATSASAVATGGTATREFFSKLYTWAAEQRIVPLPDNSYGMVVPPRAVNQLKNDMDKYWQVPTESELMALTNMMLMGYPNGENLKINGYVGHIDGIHLWTTNIFGTGGVGTEGVYQETDGTTGDSIFREGYLFGDSTIGRGIGGSGAQIIYDENRDFGRIDRAIWNSYEGFEALDVDPTGYNDTQEVPQELRVARVRFADDVVA